MKEKNNEEIKAYLAYHLENTQGNLYLRSIHKDKAKDGEKTYELFTRDTDEVIQFIAAHRDQYNLYCGANTRILGQRGKKENVLEYIGPHADMDFKDYAGGEKEARSILNSFPLKPTMVVFSGGGFQPRWILEQPVFVNGNYYDFEAINKGIKNALKANDHCQDISRILRIPETINFPGEKKRKAGRTDTGTRLFSNNGKKYSLDDFEPYKVSQPNNTSSNTSTATRKCFCRILESRQCTTVH